MKMNLIRDSFVCLVALTVIAFACDAALVYLPNRQQQTTVAVPTGLTPVQIEQVVKEQKEAMTSVPFPLGFDRELNTRTMTSWLPTSKISIVRNGPSLEVTVSPRWAGIMATSAVITLWQIGLLWLALLIAYAIRRVINHHRRPPIIGHRPFPHKAAAFP